MKGITKRASVAVLAFLTVLILSGPAPAQFVVGGGLPGGVVNPVTGTVMPSMSTPSWGGYSAYGSMYSPSMGSYGSPISYPSYTPYIYDPFAEYLRGAADIYRAQGNYSVNYAQTKILLEKARQDAVDTRRKIYDQWLYE